MNGEISALIPKTSVKNFSKNALATIKLKKNSIRYRINCRFSFPVDLKDHFLLTKKEKRKTSAYTIMLAMT
jgi:hypothetical protein